MFATAVNLFACVGGGGKHHSLPFFLVVDGDFFFRIAVGRVLLQRVQKGSPCLGAVKIRNSHPLVRI